jgi:hypothetical protein
MPPFALPPRFAPPSPAEALRRRSSSLRF